MFKNFFFNEYPNLELAWRRPPLPAQESEHKSQFSSKSVWCLPAVSFRTSATSRTRVQSGGGGGDPVIRACRGQATGSRTAHRSHLSSEACYPRLLNPSHVSHGRSEAVCVSPLQGCWQEEFLINLLLLFFLNSGHCRIIHVVHIAVIPWSTLAKYCLEKWFMHGKARIYWSEYVPAEHISLQEAVYCMAAVNNAQLQVTRLCFPGWRSKMTLKNNREKCRPFATPSLITCANDEWEMAKK